LGYDIWVAQPKENTMTRASDHAPEDLHSAWPALPLESWKDTYATLHMWTQIVGKVKLALTPLVNHWWNVPLYVSSHGLTTSAMAYGTRTLEIQFDFLTHQLKIQCSDGGERTLKLRPQSVADFYHEFMDALRSAGIEVKIWRMPAEIPNPIPFDEDRVHAAYDAEAVGRFWRILLSVDEVMKEFRARFIGKSSPVHFFWGSFDMAVTRFSGRRAPERPNADSVTREAYSHECISSGFWPGSGEIKQAAFYSYAAPAPKGLREAKVLPSAALYHSGLGEFLLMYDDVRNAPDPRAALLDFLQTTYEAGATLGNWDRQSLERSTPTGVHAA
jgi:Family of unknown function (DUF5996)